MPRQGSDSIPEPRIPLISLKDIHPFHGGQSLYLWRDGSVVCQVVKYDREQRMFVERRYQTTVKRETVDRLSELIDKHGFFDIVVKQRPGIPEETRPAITVTLAPGKTRTVAKWANDKHPDFDAIYKALLKQITEAERGDPVFKGRYDPKWKPPRIEPG